MQQPVLQLVLQPAQVDGRLTRENRATAYATACSTAYTGGQGGLQGSRATAYATACSECEDEVHVSGVLNALCMQRGCGDK